MISTFVFLAFSASFAWLLWHDRPARNRKNALRLLRTVVLIVLPVAALGSAAISDRGERLTVRTGELRVPLARVSETAGEGMRPFLIIGDRADAADLVVSPYPDESLSRVSLPAEPRTFAVVEANASRDAAGVQVLAARLRLQSFAPLEEMEVPGMGVSVGGMAVPPGEVRHVDLLPNREIVIAVQRLEPDKEPKERRSVTVRLTGGRSPAVELLLHSPLVADAGTCATPRLRLAPAGNAAAETRSFRDPENLVFAALGSGGANPVLDPRWLGPVAHVSLLCQRAQTQFAWPASAGSENAALQFVANRAFLPLFSALFVAFCALAVHRVCARHWETPTPERVLVPLLQWLMALRLLIAIAGYYNVVDVRPVDALWDGMASFLCVPLLAIAALRTGGREGDGQAFLTLALLVAFGSVALWIYLDQVSLLSIPTWLCVFTAGALLARLRLRRAPVDILVSFIDRKCGGGGEAATSAVAEPSPPWKEDARTLPAAAWWGVAILALLACVRIGLALIGGGETKLTERIGPIPLSVVYVPVALLGFALLLEGVRRMEAGRASKLAVLLFLLVYVAAAYFTSDFGTIFVFGWPVAGVIAWYGLRHSGTHGRRSSRALNAVPALVPALLIAGYGLFLTSVPVPPPASAAIAPAGASARPEALPDLGRHIAEVTSWDRNDIRLLAYVDPSTVEKLGTKHAFEALELIASLRPLTSGLFGHGYLAPPNVRGSVATNQFFENLPSIHLIWPVGRLGAAGLLIVMAAGVAALRPEGRSVQGDWRTLLGILSAATFLWAAAYMLLANLNWVPFTGRNAYLLAVTSGGDLPEGLALLLMMCAPFVRRTAAGSG